MSTKEHTPGADFDWTVVGAGPAGIATVGKLIDAGVDPKRVAWIDPQFKVGDFGTKWRNVSGNTNVGLFVEFLNCCKAFHYRECDRGFSLHQQDPTRTCELHRMAEPLEWVTAQLRRQVVCFETPANSLKAHDQVWHVALAGSSIRSHNVVLAIGADPVSLRLPGVEEIPLADAMDAQRLAGHCSAKDTVAVFGSSHSAILAIRLLIEHCGVKQVVNFFQAPLRFAVPMGDWIQNDDTGLKGATAEWARTHIEAACHPRLERHESTEANMKLYLPRCTKAIYAVGFARRHIPVAGLHELRHNPSNGVIAPGLFGVGIAFPEAKVNRDGTLEHRVGLWKFMQYLSEVLPHWLRTSDS
ncbi:MAG: pyridine nucleotide-disulfide oxidoreductase [Planctomycetes bacterium]|nr:pyridine nucleotide-disulfide oxidoreductase [Planctomycetota bacterium]